jgi:hypothetical protein
LSIRLSRAVSATGDAGLQLFDSSRFHIHPLPQRLNGTLQDRLVKEMRLSGIDTIEAGNAFLPAFMEKYNARFAKAPYGRSSRTRDRSIR